jgi:hypothetical protein
MTTMNWIALTLGLLGLLIALGLSSPATGGHCRNRATICRSSGYKAESYSLPDRIWHTISGAA